MKARESVSALRARMLRIGAVGSNRSSIASTMSSFSPHASPSPAPSPMHATPMEDRSDEKPFEEVLGEQIEDSLQRRLIQEQEQELQEKILQKQKEERLRWEREDSRRQKVEAPHSRTGARVAGENSSEAEGGEAAVGEGGLQASKYGGASFKNRSKSCRRKFFRSRRRRGCGGRGRTPGVKIWRRLIQEQEQELQEKILQKQKEERLRWERE